MFTRLGFEMVIHNDLAAENIRFEIENLGKRSFLDDDALVSDIAHFNVIIPHFERALRLHAKLTSCWI